MRPYINLGILVGICWVVCWTVYVCGWNAALRAVDEILKEKMKP